MNCVKDRKDRKKNVRKGKNGKNRMGWKGKVKVKSKVKNYLFMKYNKNIQNKVFQEKIFKNL